LFSARYAEYQALKFEASCALVVYASWNARFAFARVAVAFASLKDDSVPHFAAE
jgi:hypothetical protein